MHVPLVVFVCFAFEQFLKHTPYEINSIANLERYKSEYDKHKQGALIVASFALSFSLSFFFFCQLCVSIT
jgi:hypothetical protein